MQILKLMGKKFNKYKVYKVFIDKYYTLKK